MVHSIHEGTRLEASSNRRLSHQDSASPSFQGTRRDVPPRIARRTRTPKYHRTPHIGDCSGIGNSEIHQSPERNSDGRFRRKSGDGGEPVQRRSILRAARGCPRADSVKQESRWIPEGFSGYPQRPESRDSCHARRHWNSTSYRSAAGSYFKDFLHYAAVTVPVS